MSTTVLVRIIALRKVILQKQSGRRLFGWLWMVRPQRSCDQDETAHQQNQHHHGVEKAGWLKVNVQVRDDAGKDEQRSRNGQKPADGALAVPE
jgi:hypothetical protein